MTRVEVVFKTAELACGHTLEWESMLHLRTREQGLKQGYFFFLFVSVIACFAGEYSRVIPSWKIIKNLVSLV